MYPLFILMEKKEAFSPLLRCVLVLFVSSFAGTKPQTLVYRFQLNVVKSWAMGQGTNFFCF